MSKVTKQESSQPEGAAESPNVVRFPTTEAVRSVLDDLVRRGAQQMLQVAIEAEVDAFLHEQQGRLNARGQRLVVRNGYLPTREIVTGAGALEIAQPRVRDKSPDAAARVRFSPQIVPAWQRSSNWEPPRSSKREPPVVEKTPLVGRDITRSPRRTAESIRLGSGKVFTSAGGSSAPQTGLQTITVSSNI